jgi:FkbM family methyltransferase
VLKLYDLRIYWRESRTPIDFLRLLRVRLSQSKIGLLVCPRPIVVDIDLQSLGRSVRLRSHTTDISVLGELLCGHAYEVAAGAVSLSSGQIVDLGANTGLAARWFLERFPTARIVSVEPERENLSVLRYNLASYGSRADVIGAAVGGHERRASLRTSRGEFGFSLVEPSAGDDDVTVVTMTTVLADVGGNIDFLKCDIEGAEEELFDKCADWVTRVRLASVECHGSFTQTRLIEMLQKNGVSAEVVHSDSTPQFGVETVLFRVRKLGETEIEVRASSE